MNINIKPLPTHGYKVAAVASEVLLGNNPFKVELLTDSSGITYNVIDHIKINKGQTIPKVLMLLAFGQSISEDKIFSAYVGSDSIIFFICQKQDSNTK